MNNIELFIGMTILGIMIISTYFYYIGKSSTELVDKLWVGIDKKYRPLYTIMMIFATIGFLAFAYYTSTNEVENYMLVVTAVLLILIPAIFWMGPTYYSIKNNKYDFVVPMVLILTALGAISLSSLLYINKVNVITQVLFLLFTLHVTILDGTIWNLKYVNSF